MKFGDLSNEAAPKVGIRFEAVIYNFGKINQPGKAYCEYVLTNEYNLCFFTLLPERKVKAWCYKWGIVYTTIIEASSLLEIPELCRAHKLILYVDTDDRLLEEVTARGNPRIEVKKWEQALEIL